MKLMNKMMFSCQRISEIITQDEAISTKERLKFKLHLLVCGVCRAFFKQNQILQRKMKQIYNSSEQNVDNDKIADKAIEKIIDKT